MKYEKYNKIITFCSKMTPYHISDGITTFIHMNLDMYPMVVFIRIIEINRSCNEFGIPNYTSYGGIRIVYCILGMRTVIRPIPPPELITPPELRVVVTLFVSRGPPVYVYI